MTSGIEWTDETWNPLTGCEHVSEGCDECYAAREAAGRLKNHPAYEGLAVRPEGGGPAKFTGEVRLLPDRLDQPLRWKRPRRIFVNSMSDLFHRDVPVEFIADVFAVMAMAPQHQFQILTKRPQRMADLTSDDRDDVSLVSLVEQSIRRRHPQAPHKTTGDGYVMPGVWDEDGMTWPLPNVHLGTSIELDKYTFRANHIRRTPAAVRWLSLEPLLGPLPSLDLTGIDWVVVGGESGPNARPMNPNWVRDIIALCAHGNPCPDCRDGLIELSYGRGLMKCGTCPSASEHRGTGRVPVPLLFKQWGEWAPWRCPDGDPETLDVTGVHVVSSIGGLFPLKAAVNLAFLVTGDSTMRRIGKKAAGRELNGVTYDAYPVELAPMGEPMKSIETRGCPLNGDMRPPGVRGLPGLRVNRGDRIGIASTKNKPLTDEVGERWHMHRSEKFGWLLNQELSHRVVDAPLGRLYGTARVAGCAWMTSRYYVVPWTETVPAGCEHVIVIERDHLQLWELRPDGLGKAWRAGRTISHERPWGLYEPDRWGILLDDIQSASDVCPECRNQFDGKVPGHVYGSGWDWLPCQTCAGSGKCEELPDLDQYEIPVRQGVWKLDFARRKVWT